MPRHKSRFAPPQHAECENIVTLSLVCSLPCWRSTRTRIGVTDRIVGKTGSNGAIESSGITSA
jgi:hypothetical protein